MSYDPVEAVAEEMVNVINRQCAELERLRADIESTEHTWSLLLKDAEATIKRVREVSDRHPDAPWLSGPAIRAALKGES